MSTIIHQTLNRTCSSISLASSSLSSISRIALLISSLLIFNLQRRKNCLLKVVWITIFLLNVKHYHTTTDSESSNTMSRILLLWSAALAHCQPWEHCQLLSMHLFSVKCAGLWSITTLEAYWHTTDPIRVWCAPPGHFLLIGKWVEGPRIREVSERLFIDL